MKIYYAHSMKKYETEAEAEELKYINKVYPKAEIINPAELEFKDIKKWTMLDGPGYT